MTPEILLAVPPAFGVIGCADLAFSAIDRFRAHHELRQLAAAGLFIGAGALFAMLSIAIAS